MGGWMTLVIDNNRNQIGTHVLVIGVGRYPYLLDGEEPLFAFHAGMGQLTSPPHSALGIFYSCLALKMLNFHSVVCYYAFKKRENFLG